MNNKKNSSLETLELEIIIQVKDNYKLVKLVFLFKEI